MKATLLIRAAALALALHSAAAVRAWQVDVNTDMTDEGRKRPIPSPEHPVYYYAIVNGYQEMGSRIAGETPPPLHDTVRKLAVDLAKQGYLVTHEIDVPAQGPGARPGATVKAFSPPPSMILIFYWGYLNPQTIDGALGGDVLSAQAPATVINKGQMLGLLSGKHTDNVVDFGLKSTDLMQSLADNHYFVIVSAFDFDAYFKEHKRVMLWMTKMSVPSAGVTMTEVTPVLIDKGSAYFGRETIGAKLIDTPIAPDGKVDVGTPVVKGYSSPSDAAVPAAPGASGSPGAPGAPTAPGSGTTPAKPADATGPK